MRGGEELLAFPGVASAGANGIAEDEEGGSGGMDDILRLFQRSERGLISIETDQHLTR